jgi:hypothetical protein
MDRNDDIAAARRLGTAHGRAGIAPYGDLREDIPAPDLMAAIDAATGAAPGALMAMPAQDWRNKLGLDYVTSWQYAAGRDYATEPTPAGALTPRLFVLALAAAGIDADLETVGGPGSWPLPVGWLPDGRTWMISDSADAGFAGPDAPLPSPLNLVVYESAAENAIRWASEPDPRHRDGLDFNDPAGVIDGLTAAQADLVIRQAWSGNYAPFRTGGDAIGPLAPPEDATGEDGEPLFDEATRVYLRAVRLTPQIYTEPWRTSECPQCGEPVRGGGVIRYGDGEISRVHVVIRGSVVLGCEGGWIVSPAAVGISRPQWVDWRGELDCAWINQDGPERYVATLFGAHVAATETYGGALALLQAEVGGLDTDALGAPRGWQPDVYYMDHASGTIVRFPGRLAEVREEWDRPARLADELWYAGLGSHIVVEAFCLLCGERFNPAGPDDMTHGQTSEQEPCGGPGVPLAAGGAPTA